MKTNLPGTVVVAQDATELAHLATEHLAQSIALAIEARGRAFIAISGGNTPLPTYERLARHASVDWHRVHLFWVDDRAVPANHPRSNYGAAKPALIEPSGIPAENVHPMDGGAENLGDAARSYASVMASLLPTAPSGEPLFDLMVLGVGDDGHTASLFPGDAADHERALAALAAPARDGREARLSLSAPVIESARELVVLATGSGKKAPLVRIASQRGSLDETPARLLRDARGKVTWFLDPSATPAA